MTVIILESPSGAALRGASAEVKQIAQAIWLADTPAIEAEIAARVTTLATARLLLTVLTLVLKDHEERLRILEARE